MVTSSQQVEWAEKLLKYGKIAFESGLQLIFAVNRRENSRTWKIYLKREVSRGEEDFEEED